MQGGLVVDNRIRGMPPFFAFGVLPEVKKLGKFDSEVYKSVVECFG